MQSKSLVIIGSGLAGYMLAKTWRQKDKNTALTIITRSDGHFYSKPLLSTALAFKRTAAALITTRMENMAKELNATIKINTAVQEIDSIKQTIQTDKEKIAYDKLVLACGAEPILPELTGNAVLDICQVNHLEDYAIFREKLRNKKRIAILGSGLVGCEFANDLIQGGFEVSLISPDTYPLARLIPEALGKTLKETFINEGLTYHQALVKTVDSKDDHYFLTLSDGSHLSADLVLSAVGLKPNIALAKLAGLATRHGIVVNHYLETSHQNIYALGDCAEIQGEVKQYIAALLQSARVLAENLTGAAQVLAFPVMPIIVKTALLPVVTVPIPQAEKGKWEIEACNKKALFYNEDKALKGFALLGDKTQEKHVLTKQVI